MDRQILKAGVLYFSLVFGAGFVLGTVRTVWILPRVGTRSAELLEMPVMLVIILVAAGWVTRHIAGPARALTIGLMALGFLVLAELAVAFWLRHLTPVEYVTGRDPVSGTVYIMMLGVFAVMPALFVRQRAGQRTRR